MTTTRFLLGGALPLLACSTLIAQQDDAPETLTLLGSSLPVDSGAFELIHELTKDDSTYEVQGGFLIHPVRIHTMRYRDDPNEVPYADVATLTFTDNCDDCVHSVIGAMINDEDIRPVNAWSLSTKQLVADRLSQVVLLRCHLPGQAADQSVLFLKKNKWPYSGLLAWTSHDNDTATCVFVRFAKLDGVPVKLLAELLAAYPSALPDVLVSSNDWLRDDLLKWRACFTSEPTPRTLVLASGSISLSRDPDLLGLEMMQLRQNINLRERRELTAAERQALSGAIASRIDDALTEIESDDE